MHVIVGLDVSRPVTVKAGYRFLSSEIKMLVHHRSHFTLRPTFRVGAAEKVSDLIGVRIPALVGIGEFCLIVRFGCRYYFGGGCDVLFQKGGQFSSGGLAVKRFDGIAYIDLILQQPIGGRRFVW